MIGLVQIGLRPGTDPDRLERMGRMASAAAAKGARLVCLPEHWLDPNVVQEQDRVYDRLEALAERLGIYLNAGGIYEKGDEGTFLVSPTISPSGRVIARQRKVHLYGRERRKARPGSGFSVFKVDDVSVGVMVCHDLVFPESARTLALSGAELFVVPSLIVEGGRTPWRYYLRARALENRVPLVSTNAYRLPMFRGESAVIGLDYDTEQKIMRLTERVAGPGERLLLETVRFDGLAGPRRERLAERRPSAYRGWK